MTDTSGKKRGRKRIKFLLHAPQAGEVQLLGDFNQWNGQNHQMKIGRSGAWEKTLMLLPDTYEYKYLVDGKWQLDPANSRNRQNAFGAYNNVLTVEA